MVVDWVFEERLAPIHPVVLIGRWGRFLEELFLRHLSGGLPQRIGGILLLLLVSLPVSLLTWWLIRLSGSKIFGNLLSVYLASLFLAGKGLYVHVRDVLIFLEKGDLPGARTALSRIVGRDTAGLPEPALARGALESLSENLTDAVIAPLFFLILGGVPLLVFYKAVSTMDSQVGYKNERYRDLGWASARMDDFLAFVPARLTLLLCLASALFSRNSGYSLRKRAGVMIRDRLLHPSPNSGHGIAGYAGLLAISLGGGASYSGQWVEKPVIGEGFPKPDAGALRKALFLYRYQLAGVFGLLVLDVVILFSWLHLSHPAGILNEGSG